ncbi:hypothetical protein TNCV_3549271 [Trichonephila clavipes]|nr:hypothetical protein TNCV_3549271 [Trichonephila clavipes]
MLEVLIVVSVPSPLWQGVLPVSFEHTIELHILISDNDLTYACPLANSAGSRLENVVSPPRCRMSLSLNKTGESPQIRFRTNL